ncbi:hypothetical protein CM1200mP19_1180 [bacterium]|nr:MAG: hypothetical protein CM1200mP19_1180 [bacterium]
MDAQCNDASIALYSSLDQGERLFRPHSFSNKPGVAERLEHVAETMAVLGGMVLDDHLRLKFPCGEGHLQACRRLFLDSVKLDMNDPIEPRPLSVDDRKTGDTILVHSNGSGEYTLSKESNEVDERNRLGVATLGLVKLGELEKCSGSENRIRFTCGVPHDELLALLLTRALDVRSAARENRCSRISWCAFRSERPIRLEFSKPVRWGPLSGPTWVCRSELVDLVLQRLVIPQPATVLDC